MLIVSLHHHTAKAERVDAFSELHECDRKASPRDLHNDDNSIWSEQDIERWKSSTQLSEQQHRKCMRARRLELSPKYRKQISGINRTTMITQIDSDYDGVSMKHTRGWTLSAEKSHENVLVCCQCRRKRFRQTTQRAAMKKSVTSFSFSNKNHSLVLECFRLLALYDPYRPSPFSLP